MQRIQSASSTKSIQWMPFREMISIHSETYTSCIICWWFKSSGMLFRWVFCPYLYGISVWKEWSTYMCCCKLQNIKLQQDNAVIFCAIFAVSLLPLCSQQTNLIMNATTIKFFFEFVLGSKPQLDQSVHFASSKSPVIWSRLVLFWISEEWRSILWIWPQLRWR